MNSQHDFINEICAEEGIQLESLSQNYVLRLTKNGQTRTVFGAFWDINSAAADRIACDKTACYSMLHSNKIPAIAHELFYNPMHRMGWARPEGTWANALRFFESCGNLAVLKPNQGTRGNDVYLCDSIPAMEAAAHAIFTNHPSAAISPYRKIETEYRVFYLNGKCYFVYGKTASETWQHNLAQGAKAVQMPNETEEDKKWINKLYNLAIRAANCIGINFATIDIAESHNKEIAIMEINSGVQAKILLNQLPQLRPIIKNIYTAAIKAMFV